MPVIINTSFNARRADRLSQEAGVCFMRTEMDFW
jgi:hypothetical protein